MAKITKLPEPRQILRLDQAARSIFLAEFVQAFFLSMRYFFKPKATINYPFEKKPAIAAWNAPRFDRTGSVAR